MHIYKFRIVMDDNDQFFREIDIRANQTFETFHQAIAASAGFDNSEMSSFYICDSKWKKQQEICLCDMTLEDEEEGDAYNDDEDDEPQKGKTPILTMCDTQLKDVIIDPHQRMIYVYDFLKMHTFYIELYKIKESVPGVEYPMLVKSVGEIHRPLTNVDPELDDDEQIEDPDDIEDAEERPDDEMLDGLYDDTIIN